MGGGGDEGRQGCGIGGNAWSWLTPLRRGQHEQKASAKWTDLKQEAAFD
jgi:hypothetical protein